LVEDQTYPPLQLPARALPVPRHISPEGQAMLGTVWPPEYSAYPALDDIDGWHRQIARSNAGMLQMFAQRAAVIEAEVRDIREGAALAYEVTPAGVTAADRRVYLDFHGGALVVGAGEACRAMGIVVAGALAARVVSVDYRMPPDHPYPAALDDGVAIYRALLRDHRPQDIVIGGLSAGGNLAAATILRARDEGLPLPAGAVLLSPEIDLTESGDSFRTGLDSTMGDGLMQPNLLYAGGHDLSDPYLSPLFGDFAKGFPPTFLAAGTRDLFLSSAARMQRKLRALDIPAELQLVEAAPHSAFVSWPEMAEIDRDMRLFCERRWRGE
jgi:acetyl esterase/lipase